MKKQVAKELVKLAKSLLANEEEGFGINNDGWDKEDLADIMELLKDFQKVQYELEHCRRGSYAINGENLKDLVEKLNRLKENLDTVIEDLNDKIKESKQKEINETQNMLMHRKYKD